MTLFVVIILWKLAVSSAKLHNCFGIKNFCDFPFLQNFNLRLLCFQVPFADYFFLILRVNISFCLFGLVSALAHQLKRTTPNVMGFSSNTIFYFYYFRLFWILVFGPGNWSYPKILMTRQGSFRIAHLWENLNPFVFLRDHTQVIKIFGLY